MWPKIWRRVCISSLRCWLDKQETLTCWILYKRAGSIERTWTQSNSFGCSLINRDCERFYRFCSRVLRPPLCFPAAITPRAVLLPRKIVSRVREESWFLFKLIFTSDATRGNQPAVMQRWLNEGKLLMEIEAAVIYRKFVQGRTRIKPALIVSPLLCK